MRNRTLRRVEVLEREGRSRQLHRRSTSKTILFLSWKIVLAHYVGGLRPDDEDPGDAHAKALEYESRFDYLEALSHAEELEIDNRFKNAARRLFTLVDLDFDRSPPGALSDSFIRMVNQLPEQWLRWLNSNLPEDCRSAPIGAGSEIPLGFRLSAAEEPQGRVLSDDKKSRNSRVFTQINELLPPSVPEELLREESKVDFWAFRRFTRPTMKIGWWQHEIANELQRFYRSLINGERPKLVLMAPPQHGKTEQVRDFIAWIAGKHPDLKTIFASYSDDLGLAVNTDLQRMMTSSRYVAIFGHRFGDGRSRWLRNSNVLEYENHRGSFRNTTVGGQITGQGLDLGIVDDPIKGRAEASSKAARDKIWDWFTDDFFTRFGDSAGVLMIMTRWHLDDPVGRFIERFPEAKILRYPAIAEEDEKNRSAGEALFPQHKSLPFLMERQTVMTRAAWESEYQQNPIVVGGGIFPIEKLTTMPLLERSNILKSVRYWDKAGTEDAGAYTAGVLIHMLKDKRFVVAHVVRGQWSALEREKQIKAWAERDRGLIGGSYEVGVEQEPGSAGKESAESTIRNLAGYKVFADRVTGSKEVRAEPFAAQVQGGNVYLVAGPWHREYLGELEQFPSGKFRDQVDASTGAFNRLVGGPSYSLFSGWLDDDDE